MFGSSCARYAFCQIEDTPNSLTVFLTDGYQILSNAFSPFKEIIMFFFFFHFNVVDYIDFE